MNINTSKEDTDIDTISNQKFINQNKIIIKKMIFLYQALLDGWTIRMINDKNFEFKKAKN